MIATAEKGSSFWWRLAEKGDERPPMRLREHELSIQLDGDISP
jgi:hypothetical protein